MVGESCIKRVYGVGDQERDGISPVRFQALGVAVYLIVQFSNGVFLSFMR